MAILMRLSKSRSTTRKIALAKYGHLYLPFKPPGIWYESACVYCGNRAQERDHIPPLSWLYCLGSDYFLERGLLICWVPSCKECNKELSDNKLFSIKERTLHLLGRYVLKYDPFLKGTAWNDEQLEELTGGLKRDVSRFADYQKAIDRRIGILEENIVLRSMPQEF